MNQYSPVFNQILRLVLNLLNHCDPKLSHCHLISPDSGTEVPTVEVVVVVVDVTVLVVVVVVLVVSAGEDQYLS